MILKNITSAIIPEYIIAILQTIDQNGYEGYIVGGAIRDLGLGKIPKEYDIATNASPKDVIRLFDQTIPTGIKFGTVTVLIQSHSVEVTTFRKESNYDDARRPSNVLFSNSIHDDLMRRDFTINAFAYNPINDQFIDNFDGISHLENRQLICVGDPLLRFKEDTLRPFRCFRFISQFGLIIDSNIRFALETLSTELTLPAIERIRQEMDRLLVGSFWESSLNLMTSTGWLSLIISNPLPVYKSIDLPRELLFRWGWLLKDSTDSLKNNLNFSKKDIQRIMHIIEWNFDEYAINLTVKNINISTQALQDMGYHGVELGKIQSKLLKLIRKKELNNSIHDIKKFLQKKP